MSFVSGKENIEEGSADEAWFILSNLNSLDQAQTRLSKTIWH